MRIFWWSNAPWARTGYGTQTRIFVPRIVALGHEVVLGASYGLGGSPLELGEHSRIYPLGIDRHGNDVLVDYAKHTKADIVITLYDAWPFMNQVTSQFRWCPWAPIDHKPLAEPVRQAISTAWQPITYSRFGYKEVQEAGLDPVYVPHGIETDVYKPRDKAEARKKFGLPGDGFLAVMVAANKGWPSRKSFGEVLAAWKKFTDRHDEAVLYMHTHFGGEMAGADLKVLIEKLGIPGQQVAFADPFRNTVGLGYDDHYMVDLYNAADVLVNPSMGEGFGLPILEAQACGTPVIVGSWTSMPELCFAGWKVRGQPFWNPNMAAWQYVPFINSILSALEKAYNAKGSRRLREKAREGALHYDADLVTEKYWKPVLEAIEAEIEEGGELEAVSLEDAWGEADEPQL